ncbi:RNA-binding RNA annealing protein [Cryptotrichosporon argae]
MKVEIAIDPNAVQSLATRVAPAASAPAAAGRARQPQTARRGHGGAVSARAPRPAKKSAEDLDAEMAAYKTAA